MTTHNSDHGDNLGLKFNYDMLANAIILHAIDDLGYDALDDEGVNHWADAFHIDTNIIRHGIEAMPLKKNGMPDAKPAIRRIMETLDARDPIKTWSKSKWLSDIRRLPTWILSRIVTN